MAESHPFSSGTDERGDLGPDKTQYTTLAAVAPGLGKEGSREREGNINSIQYQGRHVSHGRASSAGMFILV